MANKIYLHNVAQVKKVGDTLYVNSDGNGVLDEKTVIAEGTDVPRALKDRFADVINVKDFGAKGDGVTDDSDSIHAMIREHGYALFLAGTYLCAGTFDGNLVFGAGAALTAKPGTTVTITGRVDAPRQWIFKGDGSYMMNHDDDSGEDSRMVHVSWFGASPSVRPDDDQTDYIQKACDSFGNGREGVIEFDVGNYFVTRTINVSRGTWIKGSGTRRTVFHVTSDGWPVFDTKETACRFSDIQLELLGIDHRTYPFIQLSHSWGEVHSVMSMATPAVWAKETGCRMYDIFGVSGVELDNSSALVKVMAGNCTVKNVYAITSGFGHGALVLLDSTEHFIGGTLVDNVQHIMPSESVRIVCGGNLITNTKISNIRSSILASATKTSSACVNVINNSSSTIRGLIIDSIGVFGGVSNVISISQGGSGSIQDVHVSNVCNNKINAGISVVQTAGSITHLTFSDSVDVKSADVPFNISGNVTDIAIAPTALGNARPPCTYDFNITDDTVQVVDLMRNVFTGFLLISAGYDRYGFYVLRAASTTPLLTPVSQQASFNVVNGTVLTGTTGSDGKFNVSTKGTKIYLENRIGSTQRVSCTVFTGIQ